MGAAGADVYTGGGTGPKADEWYASDGGTVVATGAEIRSTSGGSAGAKNCPNTSGAGGADKET